MLILGIETSCDETSAAIVKNGRFVLSNVVSSQVSLHKKYGGVVPEIAARAHIENIIPVIRACFDQAKKKWQDIDAIAVTYGPGLITSLLIGVETAKTLAYVKDKSLLAINHLEGHIYANWLKPTRNFQFPISNFQYPILCLVVSGGHTMLVLMKNHGEYETIGQTRDDAAGEAFDKVAKLLKIGYPGGPVIEKWAKEGNAEIFDLPRPMINSKNFDFSFSGLKTAVIEQVKSAKLKMQSKKGVADLCASFQQAAVDVLVFKTIKTAKKYRVKTVMLAGGVAANKLLRKTLQDRLEKELPNILYLTPDISFCTDNAAMIASAGYFHAKSKDFTSWQKLEAKPNAELGD